MKHISIDLTPEQYHIADERLRAIARSQHIATADICAAVEVHRTLDCRRRHIVYHTDLDLYLHSDADRPQPFPYAQMADALPYPAADAPQVVIVGAGPAGLFAALRCIEHGLRPIIVERGLPVEQRKYSIARLAREKMVDPDSNWCFGEGGAGTYSDGKLYTRSTKRGDVASVLRWFVAHGAEPDIMLDAHAHIGTDRLSGIIARMRRTVETHGGRYLFGTRMEDLLIEHGQVHGIVDQAGNSISGQAVILATGHSARDVYSLFFRRGWLLEAKPFALGVRIEHPQELINQIQYHGAHYSPYLPPAAYTLRGQSQGHGVFSFCMCPGGIIVPAATAQGEQVVNGMSNSRRNSPYANSGIAVSVSEANVEGSDALSLLRFQQGVEQKMYAAAGNAIKAPSMRLVDFMRGKPTGKLNPSGYLGETVVAPLHELLPPFVVKALAEGFRQFDQKMHGFVCEEATLLAVESRTSSPVRIPRLAESMQHPTLPGLYPCGEGAGYAGGIVSSALDGQRVADAVAHAIA